MTTKSTSNGRAAKVLGHMRQFVIDGHIAGAVLRDLGLDYTGDGLAFGEYADGVHGLLVEARLAEGFGSTWRGGRKARPTFSRPGRGH